MNRGHTICSGGAALGRRARKPCFWLLAALFEIAAQAQGPGFSSVPLQIPNIDKSQRRPVTSMDLLAIRDVKGATISPDGRYVAFVVGQAVYDTNSYRSGMFIIGTTPGSTPANLGTAGLPHYDEINQWYPESPQWSPDSRYITYRARMTPVESWQVWQWNLDERAPMRLSNVPGDVQDYHWSSDGSTIIMTVAKPRDPARAKRLSEDGIIYDGFSLFHGRPVVSQFLKATAPEKETWSHNVVTGEEKVEAKSEGESASPWMREIGEQLYNSTTFKGHHILDAKVSPDGRRVAYRYINDHPDKKSIYILFSKSVKQGSPIDVAPDVYYVSDYWWSADSTKIFYAKYDGDGRSYKILSVSPLGGTSTEVYGGPEILYFDSVDQRLEYVACVNENPHSPGRIALLDLRTNALRILVDVNPEFQNIELGATTRLDGVNKFGQKWFAHLVRPVNYEPGKRYPLIVTTYTSGDGFLRGASGDENPIHVYAAHGFVVLSFDMGLRTASNRPGDFEEYLSWFASEADSIEMAIRQAWQMGMADLGKVGLTGYSRGSEIARYAITHTNLFHAVSGASGDESPYFYYMSGKIVQNEFSRRGLGGWPEGASKSNWKKVAADLNADLIDVPILDNDPDSEVLGDLSLYTSLKDLGKPIELVIYPDELHHISQPKHRYQMYERNLDWFRFWLKNEEDEDPAKKEQYERWRTMRELKHTPSAK